MIEIPVFGRIPENHREQGHMVTRITSDPPSLPNLLPPSFIRGFSDIHGISGIPNCFDPSCFQGTDNCERKGGINNNKA